MDRNQFSITLYFDDYFNRINFREIKFRVFANFRHFRENKTREIVWDSSFAKLNPREIFEIAFSREKPVKDLHLLQKIAIFTWILGSFAKLNPREFFRIADSRK